MLQKLALLSGAGAEAVEVMRAAESGSVQAALLALQQLRVAGQRVVLVGDWTDEHFSLVLENLFFGPNDASENCVSNVSTSGSLRRVRDEHSVSSDVDASNKRRKAVADVLGDDWVVVAIADGHWEEGAVTRTEFPRAETRSEEEANWKGLFPPTEGLQHLPCVLQVRYAASPQLFVVYCEEPVVRDALWMYVKLCRGQLRLAPEKAQSLGELWRLVFADTAVAFDSISCANDIEIPARILSKLGATVQYKGQGTVLDEDICFLKRMLRAVSAEGALVKKVVLKCPADFLEGLEEVVICDYSERCNSARRYRSAVALSHRPCLVAAAVHGTKMNSDLASFLVLAKDFLKQWVLQGQGPFALLNLEVDTHSSLRLSTSGGELATFRSQVSVLAEATFPGCKAVSHCPVELISSGRVASAASLVRLLASRIRATQLARVSEPMRQLHLNWEQAHSAVLQRSFGAILGSDFNLRARALMNEVHSILGSAKSRLLHLLEPCKQKIRNAWDAASYVPVSIDWTSYVDANFRSVEACRRAVEDGSFALFTCGPFFDAVKSVPGSAIVLAAQDAINRASSRCGKFFQKAIASTAKGEDEFPLCFGFFCFHNSFSSNFSLLELVSRCLLLNMFFPPFSFSGWN